MTALGYRDKYTYKSLPQMEQSQVTVHVLKLCEMAKKHRNEDMHQYVHENLRTSNQKRILISYSFDWNEGFEVFESEALAIIWLRETFDIPENFDFMKDVWEWANAMLDGYHRKSGKSFQAFVITPDGVERWKCGL